MSNYSIQASPGWDVRDALTTGATGKTISATDFHNEFTAIADAIDDKADLASPELTGTPKATTASAGTNTDQIATTQYVTSAITTLALGTASTQGYFVSATEPVGTLESGDVWYQT